MSLSLLSLMQQMETRLWHRKLSKSLTIIRRSDLFGDKIHPEKNGYCALNDKCIEAKWSEFV